MTTNAATLEHASAMPAPTWHFLGMNDAVIHVPEGLAIAPCVQASMPSTAKGAPDEFENAIADAQEEWEASHPAPTTEELEERQAFLAAEADATYGGTAQSSYQAGADAVEDSRSLATAFENGTGAETAALLRYAAGDPIVIASGPGHEVDAQVTVSASPGTISVAEIDVIADQGSTVNLSILVDGPENNTDAPTDANDPLSPIGITGTTVRVFADTGSHVSIARTQTLGDGFSDVDDMGLFAASNARISVSQTVLGASTTFTGLAGDLRGDDARINIDTSYLGHGTQEHDFNYSLRHHGQRTKCSMQANGVLAGKSKKTLRGTIDLIRGCKGAEGSEQETVLLVDEDVRNKTVPVILCNEDDVAGNHGATIGHIRDEQLFYLASRGLSQEAAERMFVNAALERAAVNAPDQLTRDAVIRLGERVTPGFAESFDD